MKKRLSNLTLYAAALVILSTIVLFFSLAPPSSLRMLCPRDRALSMFFSLFPLLHFLSYGTMTFLLALCTRASGRFNPLITIAAPIFFSGAVELLQGTLHIPGHSPSWEDFAINCAGIGIALLVWIALSYHRGAGRR